MQSALAAPAIPPVHKLAHRTASSASSSLKFFTEHSNIIGNVSNSFRVPLLSCKHCKSLVNIDRPWSFKTKLQRERLWEFLCVSGLFYCFQVLFQCFICLQRGLYNSKELYISINLEIIWIWEPKSAVTLEYHRRPAHGRKGMYNDSENVYFYLIILVKTICNPFNFYLFASEVRGRLKISGTYWFLLISETAWKWKWKSAKADIAWQPALTILG